MSIATWCYRNHLLDATITADDAEQALGVDQLQNDQGSASMGWQTPAGVTASWFQITVPAARAFRGFGLFRTNLTTQAQVRWRAGSLDTGMVSAGVQPGYGQSVLIRPADVTTQTVRCDISDPNNPDGFLNIALAYAGEAWTPKMNIGYQSAAGNDMQVDAVVTRGGQEWPSLRWERRRYEVDHQAIAADEVWPRIMELQRVARRGGNILFVPDPASAEINREAVFGRVVSQSDVTYPHSSTRRRAWRGRITERL